ncbi:MAG TPA: hypothetical protein VIG69_05810 [Candidatus Methylomirabilis sp.]
MARTIFRIGFASLFLVIPWIPPSVARADDAGAKAVSGVPGAALATGAGAGSAAGTASGGSATLGTNTAQNASAPAGSRTPTPGTTTSSPPSPSNIQASQSQTANLRVQNPGGTSVNAQLGQTMNVQITGGTGPAPDVSTRQVTRLTTTNDATFIRMVEEIRIQNQRIDQTAAQPGGEARVTQALARTFGTSPARIRAEAAGHHLGLGELAIARALARATAGSDHPLTLRQVIALRESEGGWGQVFHHLRDEGLVNERNLGQVVRHARTAARTSGTAVGSSGAQAHATTRAATGERARAEAESRATVRGDGTATAEARARAQVTTGANGDASGAPMQTVRTRAEVRDAGGNRFADAAAHRSAPGALDVRVRAPEAARTRPIAITTAGNRTDVVTAGGTAGHGAARAAPSSPGGGNGSAARGTVTGAGHGRSGAAVASTSAGNGSLAGGGAAVSSPGHGNAGHGHAGRGGHNR